MRSTSFVGALVLLGLLQAVLSHQGFSRMKGPDNIQIEESKKSQCQMCVEITRGMIEVFHLEEKEDAGIEYPWSKEQEQEQEQEEKEQEKEQEHKGFKNKFVGRFNRRANLHQALQGQFIMNHHRNKRQEILKNNAVKFKRNEFGGYLGDGHGQGRFEGFRSYAKLVCKDFSNTQCIQFIMIHGVPVAREIRSGDFNAESICSKIINTFDQSIFCESNKEVENQEIELIEVDSTPGKLHSLIDQIKNEAKQETKPHEAGTEIITTIIETPDSTTRTESKIFKSDHFFIEISYSEKTYNHEQHESSPPLIGLYPEDQSEQSSESQQSDSDDQEITTEEESRCIFSYIKKHRHFFLLIASIFAVAAWISYKISKKINKNKDMDVEKAKKETMIQIGITSPQKQKTFQRLI